MPDLSTRESRRSLIESAFHHGIQRVAPDAAVRMVLQRVDEGLTIEGERVPVAGRLVVVAIGKAAPTMARAARDVLGDRIDAGFVLTKDGHLAEPVPSFTAWEASHPVPDERGIDATRAILDAVTDLTADDVVIALISGGGSALFEAPRDGLSLSDIQLTTDLLLRAGAPIQHLNAVRSELSQVKGGGFRRRIGAARTVSLILSDVLGNSPDIIASGPTVFRAPDPGGALQVLRRYDLLDRAPRAVTAHLHHAVDTGDSAGSQAGDRDLYRIVGDNERFVSAIQQYFEDAGLRVERAWREREGEAREQGRLWVDTVAESRSDVVLGGGEMTVTVRGEGTGGRNTELALAAALHLKQQGVEATVASLASDGQDGGVDAAGAIVDQHTAGELERAGIDLEDALNRNDSGGALGAVGALLVSGPTGTNVNDVYIGLRHGDQGSERMKPGAEMR